MISMCYQRRVSSGYGTEGLVSRGGPGSRRVPEGVVVVAGGTEVLLAPVPDDGTTAVGLGPTAGTGATYGALGGSESAALVSSSRATHALVRTAARTKVAYA
jgi:hypothetical protein